MASGTAILDFGAFPGASDASVAVTGQTNIVAGSLVEAWIRPVATADHTDTEHMVETFQVFAALIVAGVGFTIYGFNTSQINEPVMPPRGAAASLLSGQVAMTAGHLNNPAVAIRNPAGGGTGTRIYGQWTIAWAGNYT